MDLIIILISVNFVDSNIEKRSWNEKLGKCDFTLAFILLLHSQNSTGDPNHILSRRLPNPQEVTGSVRGFTSWIIWGKTGEESSSFLRHSTQLALILLEHGQYEAAQVISVPFFFCIEFHLEKKLHRHKYRCTYILRIFAEPFPFPSLFSVPTYPCGGKFSKGENI